MKKKEKFWHILSKRFLVKGFFLFSTVFVLGLNGAHPVFGLEMKSNNYQIQLEEPENEIPSKGDVYFPALDQIIKKRALQGSSFDNLLEIAMAIAVVVILVLLYLKITKKKYTITKKKRKIVPHSDLPG